MTKAKISHPVKGRIQSIGNQKQFTQFSKSRKKGTDNKFLNADLPQGLNFCWLVWLPLNSMPCFHSKMKGPATAQATQWESFQRPTTLQTAEAQAHPDPQPCLEDILGNPKVSHLGFYQLLDSSHTLPTMECFQVTQICQRTGGDIPSANCHKSLIAREAY